MTAKHVPVPGRRVEIEVKLHDVKDLTSDYYSRNDAATVKFDVILHPAGTSRSLNVEKITGEVRSLISELLRLHDQEEEDIEALQRAEERRLSPEPELTVPDGSSPDFDPDMPPF